MKKAAAKLLFAAAFPIPDWISGYFVGWMEKSSIQ
jgi:hypothetical protein